MIGQIIDITIRVIEAILFIRIIMSWIVQYPNQNEFFKLVYSITEPILAPFRFILPIGRTGGLDLSPIVVFFLLDVIRGFLLNIF